MSLDEEKGPAWAWEFQAALDENVDVVAMVHLVALSIVVLWVLGARMAEWVVARALLGPGPVERVLAMIVVGVYALGVGVGVWFGGQD